MRVRLAAHFDGRVIVPHETVPLPTNVEITVEVEVAESAETVPAEVRQAALERLKSRAIRGRSISSEALRRDAMYDEEGTT